MFLVVGLGNPGLKYKKTRHNLGFRALDYLQKQENLPKFKKEKKFLAETSEGILGGQRIVLAKPQAYMNSSGRSIKLMMDYFKLGNDNFIEIHDDLDLPIGTIKISRDISTKHKGVRSTVVSMATEDFIRIRLGTRPTEPIKEIKDFVLKKFKTEEKKLVEIALQKTNNALKMIIEEGAEKAMTEYNRS